MLKQSTTYDIKRNIDNTTTEKETVLATKIKVIITEHDVDNEEDKLVYNEIIKLKQEEKVSNEEIIDVLGSVRGIKNRVRDRIQQFLSGEANVVAAKESENDIRKIEKLKEQKNDSNKIIIYTTSLGVVRQTRADCLYVIKAFRSLMLKTEERDIVTELYWYDYNEKFPDQQPPQVVINGFPVGGRKEVEDLIESGEIYLMTRNIDKVVYTAEKCSKCLGHCYLNCPNCLGSGRSKTLRIGNGRELSYLKCSYCKEGLIRCKECIDQINF